MLTDQEYEVMTKEDVERLFNRIAVLEDTKYTISVERCKVAHLEGEVERITKQRDDADASATRNAECIEGFRKRMKKATLERDLLTNRIEMSAQLFEKISKFENKNSQGNQETVVITLQPLMVSV